MGIKMLRRTAAACLCAVLVLAPAGCGGPNAADGASGSISADGTYDKIDVDLSLLSSTMAYSEVFNILEEPDKYVGKIIRMTGNFNMYPTIGANGLPDFSQHMYFTCEVMDATACCFQGLEFVLTGEHTYPDDYPELGTEITVTGRFDIYEENGYSYFQLIDAVMTAETAAEGTGA